MRNVFVAYDIRDDKRRNRLFKTLEGYGVPVQLSVFECEVTDHNLVRMYHQLGRIIEGGEDSVIVMELCHRCHRNVKRMGRTSSARRGVTIVV